VDVLGCGRGKMIPPSPPTGDRANLRDGSLVRPPGAGLGILLAQAEVMKQVALIGRAIRRSRGTLLRVDNFFCRRTSTWTERWPRIPGRHHGPSPMVRSRSSKDLYGNKWGPPLAPRDRLFREFVHICSGLRAWGCFYLASAPNANDRHYQVVAIQVDLNPTAQWSLLEPLLCALPLNGARKQR